MSTWLVTNVGVQEAVIASTAESTRQRVLQNQPEEVGTDQNASLPPPHPRAVPDR